MTQADRVFSTPPTNTSANNPSGSVNPTRRRLLTIAAAGAVAAAIPTAVLAAAPAVDPVFDLIDLHRKAHAAHMVAIKEADRLEGTHGGSWSDIVEQPCVDENEAL